MLKTKKFFAALFSASLIAVGIAGPATAQPPVIIQDGLVNVAIGNIEILNDANIGIAAQVAANVCGIKVGPVAVLGTAVDRSGATETVCNTSQGDVTITQN